MKFLLSKEFSWDIQECLPHFYQVSMKCESPPVDIQDCHKNGDCPTMTIVTIMACDVQEVCQKLKQRFKNPTIEKIVKFTNPALTRDDNGEDPTCNVDVTPGPGECLDCCDLIYPESSSHSSSSDSSNLSSYIADISLVGPKPHNFLMTDGPLPSPEGEHNPHMLRLPGVVDFSYYGSGAITFSGSAIVESTDGGELVQNIIFSESVIEELITDLFVPTPVLPLPQTIQIIQIPCCDSVFTLTQELKHTLDRIKPLAAFLKTNNLKLQGILKTGTPNQDFIKLNYNTRDDQWRGNLHLVGQSPSGAGPESWDIGITFGCMQTFWQFTITLANTKAGKRSLSRLIAYYDKSNVCPSNTFFGFRFTLDTTLLQSSPATSQPIVLNDDAGFFRNLQLAFRILSQNTGSGSHQKPVDNTVPYDAAFLTTGGN